MRTPAALRIIHLRVKTLPYVLYIPSMMTAPTEENAQAISGPVDELPVTREFRNHSASPAMAPITAQKIKILMVHPRFPVHTQVSYNPFSGYQE